MSGRHIGLAWLVLAALQLSCEPRPAFTRAAIDAAPILAHAPAGFLLGAATSAHQIEGGLDNDWTEWERGAFPDGRPHIVDGSVSGRAADSWNLWEEDVRALRHLGANAYRVGIEWARLEPTEGAWDEAAAARYRELLGALRASGIEPMVTLYHFTLPRWVSSRGGWAGWDGAPAALERFAERAGAAFGDLVDTWCTMNEPNVLAVKGYVQGQWPPGEQDQKRMAAAFRGLLRAHGLAAAALRRTDGIDADGDGAATWIGLAHHVAAFEQASWSPLDGVITGLTDAFFNDAVVTALRTGRIRVSVPGAVELDEPFAPLLGSIDWLGINYYTRHHVRADLSDPSLSRQFVPEGRARNDLGWEIHPEGLYRFLLRYSRQGWPLIVTENGIADASGAERPRFLRAHLYAVDRARVDGADVRGYFHWSLVDNFEWAEGYTAPFGLFRVDFSDPERVRRPTEAVEVFREAARALGLSPAD